MEAITDIFGFMGKIYVLYFNIFDYPLTGLFGDKWGRLVAIYIHLLVPTALLARRIWDVDFIDVLLGSLGIHIYTFIMSVFFSFVFNNKVIDGSGGSLLILTLYGIMSVRHNIMTTREGIRQYKHDYYEEELDYIEELEDEVSEMKKRIKELEKNEN